MCRAGNADFVVLEGSTMQAFAAQDESDFVAMYAGMFWMLSRLAARVAASGAFSIMEGASDGIWTPDVSGSFQAPRELLEEGTAFDWELESAGWRDAPERVSLFYFTLDVLFKFVVFHELGHLHNDHGRRRTAAANQSVTNPIVAIDRRGPPLVDRSEAIPSQAREIIADCTGLEMTLRTFANEWDINEDDDLTLVFREKLLLDKTSLVSFVLTIVNLYFRLSDRSDWQETPLDRLSHPPAPFRMKALIAYVWDCLPLGIDRTIAQNAVHKAREDGDAIKSLMPELSSAADSMLSVDTPEHTLHYQAIFDESVRWTGPLVVPA